MNFLQAERDGFALLGFGDFDFGMGWVPIGRFGVLC
jgi:hypothetical protein